MSGDECWCAVVNDDGYVCLSLTLYQECCYDNWEPSDAAVSDYQVSIVMMIV